MLRTVVIAVSIALSGCVSAVNEDRADSQRKIQQQEHSLLAVDSWYIQGRLAYRSGSEGGSGTFVWKRNGEAHTINIYGGFGSNHLRISENADSATLADTQGTRTEGRFATRLLAQQTGWQLPPNKLDAWIIGAPSRSYATEQVWNGFGYLTSFVQDRWTVRYSDYQYVGGLSVPVRIQIIENENFTDAADENAAEFKKTVEVKFFIHNWGF